MIDTSRLLTAVRAEQDKTRSLIALVQTQTAIMKDLSQQLKDAIAQNDPTAMQRIQADLDSAASSLTIESQEVQQAIDENTPAGAPPVPPNPPADVIPVGQQVPPPNPPSDISGDSQPPTTEPKQPNPQGTDADGKPMVDDAGNPLDQDGNPIDQAGVDFKAGKTPADVQ